MMIGLNPCSTENSSDARISTAQSAGTTTGNSPRRYGTITASFTSGIGCGDVVTNPGACWVVNAAGIRERRLT